MIKIDFRQLKKIALENEKTMQEIFELLSTLQELNQKLFKEIENLRELNKMYEK